ncbi:MAG: VWA domain-containing protein [Desulfobulbaceae bacterium]|nr:VWA domain-containing protein [Desulfobulbaceae bacterium]
MKLSDNELKKAFKRREIPPPDKQRRDDALRLATELFVQKKAMEKKKSKGFDFFRRLMGKVIHLLIPSKGDLVMIPKRYQYILVAGILLGVGYFTVPNLLMYQEQGKQADLEVRPEQEIGSVDSVDRDVPSSSDQVTTRANKPQAEAPLLQEQVARVVEQRSRITGDKLASPPPAPGKSVSQNVTMSVAKRMSEVSGGMARTRNGSEKGGMHGFVTPEPTEHYYKDEGRDQFEKIERNKIKLVSEEPVSTFSIDVDTASYSFMRRQLNNGVLPQKNAIRVEELINYFDYDYPLPDDKSRPFKPSVAVYPSPWSKNTKLLHIGIKGYDIAPTEKPRSNLVFLLDVSGSMNSPDKLPLLKNSFRLLVNSLSPEDTVAIAVYAGAAGTILEPTVVKEKAKILTALDKLNAGGSTAGGEGIKLAYSLAKANFSKEAVNRVILATDGDFNVGITNREELKSYIERQRDSGIFLSVLGFGQGNYNDALMQTLAQNGNGNAAYIDSLSEARKVLVEEASSTLFTIAKDVKIQIEFNPAMVKEYRLIGYETRLLNREDFNNDQVDAGEVGSGNSVTAIYEITPTSGEPGLIDNLRYAETPDTKKVTKSAEYAFLKIRYKLPDSDTSTLIATPIDQDSEFKEFAAVPVEMRFATAVAGFGQVLRADPFIQNFGYEQIIDISKQVKGSDEFGYRAEFINLVRLAQSATDM